MIWRCDLVPQYLAYQREIEDAMARVLGTGRYILAEEVAAFEAEFAGYIGMAHGIGVANGTDALTLSLMALGVGPGDQVITSPFTAIPTVSAIVDAGATPVFVDVDPDTYLIDIDQTARAVTPKTRAIIPVHIFGSVVDVPRLREAVGAGIPILEDAAQAHGSRLGAARAGALADLSVFSFYPTKNLGGYGDGGMVLARDPALAERIRLLRMYGMTDKDHIVIHGVNSRLDELQAAILRVKLKYLDGMNEARRRLADRYRAGLPTDLFTPQRIPDGAETNYHIYAARYHGDRAALIRRLDEAGIQTNIYYVVPLHLQAANRYLGLAPGSLPVVERLCREVIALPMYAELTMADQDRVLESITRAAAEER
jgi:dTDP-3-amino-2,3,6-trideoxy-4-keto-D-glucose/dTDP-3-amino-3,4,6-trideoxy-alpha-D-glucose/dTDP-2,6-dideoxy-D-kanosamine transaminase